MNDCITEADALESRVDIGRPVVCVQGLGFVGSAMAIAVANARGRDNDRLNSPVRRAAVEIANVQVRGGGEAPPLYSVIGVDLPNEAGRHRVNCIRRGQMPFSSGDPRMDEALARAHAAGNLTATDDPDAFRLADIVLVDINLDIDWSAPQPEVRFGPLERAMDDLGARLRPGALVIVETTVPPGTCERVIAPRLAAALEARGLPPESIRLAHSYERVMPGAQYYSSIVDYWRVYAGLTVEAADLCERFLASVIDVESYPLTRLGSTTASETAKVLENAYRATTIAFMEEWGRFAEAVGIDLFEIVGAIRKRPTHANMRQPGFGVGGYCLTKDPLFGAVAARTLFGRPDLMFPFSSQAVRTNNAMPLVALDKLRERSGGALAGRRILLLGISYREDVGDTRYAPSQIFVEAAEREGAMVTAHDPLMSHWPELDRPVLDALPDAGRFDAVVFTQPSEAYRRLDVAGWLAGAAVDVVDANNVLTDGQRRRLQRLGLDVVSVGRG
ncbi:nucleotide sugar dehydrogenase [Azospirillum doebereinerae]|uniref:Nucleotide sugar dehydrogenase n=1 Tax=Azospirillum doebereinerae TaxID=92933 RepID=A0A3S0V1Q2_9PROT|nr:nucleotide sugar dehydrogenase [Azospirillum doebereinerae]RUQ72084.1 nucleotide sugar dehydrogenase [Azospirillum doebereinerae]